MVAGLAFRGEAKETSVEEICARTAWPKIPGHCLDGGNGQDVRYIDADLRGAEDEADAEEQEYAADMAIRFAIAFN